MRRKTLDSGLFRTFLCALFVLTCLGGCNREAAVGPQPDTDTPVGEATPVPQPEGLRLPVSLNEVMVALVNHAADPIWIAAWRNPETDKDWRNLERMAYQLEVAGAILVIPGTGPLDQVWVQDPEWQAWSGQLRQAGERAVAAVAARDLAEISTAGDRLVAVCEGCHRVFKPAEPTGGKFGELSPTAEDFVTPD